MSSSSTDKDSAAHSIELEVPSIIKIQTHDDHKYEEHSTTHLRHHHHHHDKESSLSKDDIYLVKNLIEALKNASNQHHDQHYHHHHHKREPGTRKDFHQKLFKTPKEVADSLLLASIKKTHLTFDKTIILGFLAGVYVGFGGLFAITVSQGMPNVDIGLRKFVLGFCFSVALMLIVLIGGELFTGNTMYMTVGFLKRQIKPKRAFLNLVTVYITNWLGCAFVAYFFGYLTELYHHEPWLSNLRAMTEAKVELEAHVVFLRAIPANWLVCSAIFFSLAAEDVAGKIIGMIFPVVAFASIGFEHCIANMFFLDLGLMYGANYTFGEFIYRNLILATIGNIIGGGFFVGCMSWYVYLVGQVPGETKLDQAQQQQALIDEDKCFTITCV